MLQRVLWLREGNALYGIDVPVIKAGTGAAEAE